MTMKCKCCSYAWFSGFFGLAALGHLIRLVLRPTVLIAGHNFHLRYSLVVLVVAGVLSFVFCRRSCSSCSCSKS